MDKHLHPRHIKFESVLNFRDLGGYRTQRGRTIAWRRLFRSGELRLMTDRDALRLKEEIKLRSVLDLRGAKELQLFGTGPLNKLAVKYYNLPLISDNKPQTNSDFWETRNMGEVYSNDIRNKAYTNRMIEALKIVAEPSNYPLVFHCSGGKDRTGVLSAIVLGILGVTDEDIIKDYALSAQFMKESIGRWNNEPKIAEVIKNRPDYTSEASPDSMACFLASIKQQYGSVIGYLEANGADFSLIQRLHDVLLV